MSETLREGVERLVAKWDDDSNGVRHVHWSAVPDLRALLAATAPTPDELGHVEGLSEAVLAVHPRKMMRWLSFNVHDGVRDHEADGCEACEVTWPCPTAAAVERILAARSGARA